jgi:hypothetical protein
MRTEVTVRVEDVLAKMQPMAQLHRVGRLSDLAKFVPDFEIDAAVDGEAIAKEAGFVDPDEHANEVLADLAPALSDLRDGLIELLRGDLPMGATLLMRALDDWPDGARVAEEVLLGRTVHDHRQFALLAA